MTILIAKHYWKNGENATWEYHPKLDKNIFEYLKENYHNFIKEKKSNIEKDGYYIYLCYTDSKDVYGRDITNIVFFISTKEITYSLCAEKYENLELIIKRNNNHFLVFIFIATVVSLIGYKYLSSDKKDSPESTPICKFAEDWNKLISDNNYSLDSNKSLCIKKLNIWFKPFYQEFNSSKASQYTDPHELLKYAKHAVYIEGNKYSSSPIIFSEEMEENNITESLETITNTKEKNMSSIVNKVLMMNDINIFLKKNKEQQ